MENTESTESTESSTVKTIYFPLRQKNESLFSSFAEKENKSLFVKKESKKRIATFSEKWTFTNTTHNESQLHLLSTIQSASLDENAKFVVQQINQKIHGYRAQDVDKGLYCAPMFVDLSFVIKKLVQCELSCFYCREPTMIVYEYSREPKQWTLERIDNSHGHNKDNVEIACLNCNLRRRTMYHERYLFTKQMVIQKQESSSDSSEVYTEK